jgi:hypothetical protein
VRHEDVYGTAYDIEKRIEERRIDPRSGPGHALFADHTSAVTTHANPFRLGFATMAYVLLRALRRTGLRHTQFSAASYSP